MRTLGGQYCWEVIRSGAGYRLQRHLLLRGHCRILDADDNSVASGGEAEMIAEFVRLTDRAARGLPPEPTVFNVCTRTLGGDMHWDTLDEQNGLKLQRLHHTAHYRIIDSADGNRRLANGPEGEVRAIFQGLVSGSADSDLLRGMRNPPNRRHSTLGGRYCWDTVAAEGMFRLQRHKLTRHCRILDLRNVCVDYGLERKMRARLGELARQSATLCVPAFGDVICVSRGVYDHYGIYVSDSEVIEFSPRNGNGICTIQVTTFAEFIGGSKRCCYLVFSDSYALPGKVEFSPAVRRVTGIQLDAWQTLRTFADSIRPDPAAYRDVNLADALDTPARYHLYTPAQTVERARAQVGKDHFGEGKERYSLLRNNCEHFAIWCKTGLRMSTQTEGGLLRTLRLLSALGAEAPAASPAGSGK